MEFLYEDCKSLLEQVNLQEKELRHKRRWLIGLPSSRSEAGKLKGSKFQTERPMPECLLREDDVSYETIKSLVEKLIGESNTKNKYHIRQDDMQLIHSPKDITALFSLIDDMNNEGLFQFAEVLTGGTVKFEKTRSKMKQIIKVSVSELYSKKNDTQQMSLIENHSSLLKNPHNFRWSYESRFIPDSHSHHLAVCKILDSLEIFPTLTLCAMNRKLRGIKSYMPKLVPKKTGWVRDTLIKSLRKKCSKLLSKLNESDSLQEPLAKAMEVAGLNLKLIQGSQYVTNFIRFPPEIINLQNEIAMSIQLLDQKVKISALKDIKVKLDPKAKLSERKLRMSVRNFLAECLFECGDMETVPECLLEVVAIIRKNNSSSYKHLSEMKIEEEVECILNVSACMKQVLWDVIPECEFDLEFADAYMDDLEESYDDDDVCEDMEIEKDTENNMLNSSNSDKEVGSTLEIEGDNFNSVENSECMEEISFIKSYPLNFPNSRVNPMQYHLVSLRNSENNQDVFSPSRSGVGEEGQTRNFDKESKGKNEYLAFQGASDEASMLAYRLIGSMLHDFAQIEDCELKSSDLSYLGGGGCDLKQNKDKAARKEGGAHEEDECSIIVKAVEQIIPSFAKSEADRLKELMG